MPSARKMTTPVAVDDNYATWNAYENQYWPAEYLVDASGTIRHVTFGEGDYDGTENLIRQLLAQAKSGAVLPPATKVAGVLQAPAAQLARVMAAYAAKDAA